MPKIVKVYSSHGETLGNMFGIDEAGNIWAWGYNYYGALGIGEQSLANYGAVSRPTKIIAPTKFVSLAPGGYHTLALDDRGEIWTTGWGINGRLGDGNTGTIQTSFTKLNRPTGITTVKAIDASFGYSMALTNNNQVWHWGHIYGTGVAGGQATFESISRPKKLTTNANAIATAGYTPIPTDIFAGESASYYIDQYGRTWTWGDNRYHAFGRDGG